MPKKTMRLLSAVLLIVFLCAPNLSALEYQSVTPEDILEMSFEQMLNIKISTATKKEAAIADIPASAVIITRSDIEKYGYRSLEEILENVPGMYVIDDFSAYRKTFGVRGYYSGYPRNIIFLVNGVTQTESFFDYNVMANFSIPVEAIDRIEVVRGPMSVIYGQGAFFGAINIITNDQRYDTSLASVSAGKGIYKAAAKLTDSGPGWRFSLSAGHSDDKGPDHHLGEMVSDMSTLDFWGIDGSNDTTEDRLERESHNFILSAKYQKFFIDMSFNKSTDENYVFRPSVSGGSPYEREMLKLSVGYEDQITDNMRLKGQITYHAFSFTLDWDITNDLFSGASAGQTKGESDDFEYEIDAFFDVAERLTLTTGLSLKQSNPSGGGQLLIFNIATNSYTTRDRNLWAAFAQANYAPLQKLRLVGGLRLEKLEDYTLVYENLVSGDTTRQTYNYDLETIPSLAVIYTIDDHHIVKLLYGEAISRPSYFQNLDQIIDGYPVVDGEKIKTVELNYIGVPAAKLTINFSLFHNRLENLITRTVIPTGSSLTEYLTNQGEIVTNGAECTLRATPVDNLFAEISLTYQHSEDQRDGFGDIDVAYSPHWLGYAKLAYQLSEDTTISLTGTYVDAMETEWDIRLNGGAGGRVGDKVDPYFLLGANLRFDNLFGSRCYLNIRGSNILDKAYRYPTYVNNTWADRGTLGQPRQVLVTIGLKL